MEDHKKKGKSNGKGWKKRVSSEEKNVGKAISKEKEGEAKDKTEVPKVDEVGKIVKGKTDKDEKSASADVHTEKMEKSEARLEKENFYEQLIQDDSKWSMTLEKQIDWAFEEIDIILKISTSFKLKEKSLDWESDTADSAKLDKPILRKREQKSHDKENYFDERTKVTKLEI